MTVLSPDAVLDAFLYLASHTFHAFRQSNHLVRVSLALCITLIKTVVHLVFKFLNSYPGTKHTNLKTANRLLLLIIITIYMYFL